MNSNLLAIARCYNPNFYIGLGKDEIPMVGLSTDLADYYLKNPSSAYSKIYSDLADKVKLTGVVYGILEEVMEKGSFVLHILIASFCKFLISIFYPFRNTQRLFLRRHVR